MVWHRGMGRFSIEQGRAGTVAGERAGIGRVRDRGRGRGSGRGRDGLSWAGLGWEVMAVQGRAMKGQG